MSNKQLDNEEEILREKLDQLNYEYQPADWNALEQRLPASGNSSWYSSKSFMGIASAIVLISAAIFYLQTDPQEEQQSKAASPAIEEVEKSENVGEEQKEAEISGEENREESDPESAITEEKVVADISRHEPEIGTNSASEKENIIDNTHSELAESTESIEESKLEEPANDEITLTEAEPSFEVIGLDAPTVVCPGALFNIQLKMEGELPKGWTVDWFADGNNFMSSSRITGIEIKENGTADYRVELKDQDGKLQEKLATSIETRILPELNFTYEDNPGPYNDLSIVAKVDDQLFDSYEWIGEDGKLMAKGAEAEIVFTEKGIFDMKLKASSEGCTLSKVKPVSVQNDFDPLAPNAFSPKKTSETNDTFIPVAFTQRDDQFDMKIFDRGGRLIYRTQNTNEPWNGRVNNSGQMMPAGNYIWKVTISTQKGEMREFAGNIRILY